MNIFYCLVFLTLFAFVTKSKLALSLFALASVIALIVFGIIEIVGLAKLSKVNKRFMDAFTSTIGLILAIILIAILQAVWPKIFGTGGMSTIVMLIIEIIIGINIIKGCMELLEPKKADTELKLGKITYRIFIIGVILYIVFSYLIRCNLSDTCNSIFSILSVAVVVIYELFYVVFLGKTIKKLNK